MRASSQRGKARFPVRMFPAYGLAAARQPALADDACALENTHRVDARLFPRHPALRGCPGITHRRVELEALADACRRPGDPGGARPHPRRAGRLPVARHTTLTAPTLAGSFARNPAELEPAPADFEHRGLPGLDNTAQYHRCMDLPPGAGHPLGARPQRSALPHPHSAPDLPDAVGRRNHPVAASANGQRPSGRVRPVVGALEPFHCHAGFRAIDRAARQQRVGTVEHCSHPDGNFAGFQHPKRPGPRLLGSGLSLCLAAPPPLTQPPLAAGGGPGSGARPPHQRHRLPLAVRLRGVVVGADAARQAMAVAGACGGLHRGAGGRAVVPQLGSLWAPLWLTRRPPVLLHGRARRARLGIEQPAPDGFQCIGRLPLHSTYRLLAGHTCRARRDVGSPTPAALRAFRPAFYRERAHFLCA